MRSAVLTVVIAKLCVCVLAAEASGADGQALAKMIAGAKPGTTVKIPEGLFNVAALAVPPGVTVTGAGYEKTTLVFAGSASGVTIADSADGALTDLSVRDASGPGIVVKNSSGVRIERVRVLGCGVGISIEGAANSHVANVVAADNMIGLVMTRCTKSSLVNATAANNTSLSISLAGNRDCAVFNNLFVGSQTGIACGKDNANVVLDHNCYVALFVGGLLGETTRESLTAWQSLSEYDRHSVELKVDFADAKAGNFRPVTPLPWSPSRATSSDWGVNELAGFKAPKKDIDGNLRDGGVDLGAYEVTLRPPRPADGKFTVASGTGEPGSSITSAGIYTKQGRKLASLFNNLPLAKGTYEFWLPKGIPAGQHELRLAESNLRLEYVCLIGSTGATNSLEDSPAIDPTLLIMDNKDNIILFAGGNEDYSHARSFDPTFTHARWRLNGGGGAAAAVVDAENCLYFLRADGWLFKLNAETGEGMPIDQQSFRKPIPNVFSGKGVAGMTELGGVLYVADTEKNKVFYTSTKELAFTRSFDVPAPHWPAADPDRKLLWVISGEKLLALDPATGAPKHEASPVAKPGGLALRNGRLAVSSAQTGRIHVFDCTDPANLKQVAVFGRERKPDDKPYGPRLLDQLAGTGCVAIGSTGTVATLDGNVKLFSADGTLQRAPVAHWGQFVPCGWLINPDGKPAMHFSGYGGGATVYFDAKGRTWKPGWTFQLPEKLPGDVVCYFTEGGHNFGVWGGNAPDGHGSFTILRLNGGLAKPALAIWFDKEKYDKDKTDFMILRTDTNGDGQIDQADAPQPLRTPDGKPVTSVRFNKDGRLIAGGAVIPRNVDAAGNISFDWSKYKGESKLGFGGGQGCFNGDFLADGCWVADGRAGASHQGFGGGCTSLDAIDPAGNVRWSYPLNGYHCTIGAFRSVRVLPGIVLATATEELDTVFTDHDGLGLGVAGPAADFRWGGFWHDQDWSQWAFVGDDGKYYLVIGDYVRHAYNCMEIKGAGDVRHSKVDVNVDAATAQVLAQPPAPAPKPGEQAAPSLPAYGNPVEDPRPPTPTVLVKKLPKPLPVDGDSRKWRDLGIAPQIVVASPGVRPDNCSAVVYIAWEGENLYFHVIKFDDVVTMHQPLSFFYKQDSVEVSLVGGFMGGYKFGVARTTDKGEVIYREQFLMKKELLLDPAKAPRVIKVLDNASGITERRIIEDSYCVDLSKAKVIIYEFAIPMGYAWDGKAPIEMKSGAGFWMGMFVDDNDKPGLDEQNAYPWPVTFAAFGNPDQGAWAVLE